MWNDTRKSLPKENGEYLVQTAVGNVRPMFYTVKKGWNTFVGYDGTISDKNALDNIYVVRWYEIEQPEPVPEEWFEEWRNKWKGEWK